METVAEAEVRQKALGKRYKLQIPVRLACIPFAVSAGKRAQIRRLVLRLRGHLIWA